MSTLVPKRRSGRSVRTRDAIIVAAGKVLAEQGYEATSLETVALEAGVTKGTIYYHFDAKESIYAAVLLRYLDDALSRLNVAAMTPAPAQAVREIIEQQIDDTLSPNRRYVHYQELLHLGDDVHAAVRDAQRTYERRFAEVIALAQQDGAITPADPHLLAMLIIGSIGRTARWYRTTGRIDEAEFRGTLLQFVFHGLGAP